MDRAAPFLRLVRAVVSHWSNERATLRQSISALSICITVTLCAGVILGSANNVLANTPGLMMLLPASIGMRGAVFGALAARLGTGMLLGQFTTSLRRGSFTAVNVQGALLLAMMTSVMTAGLAWGASGVFGLQTIDVLQLVIVSVVGAVISSVIVLIVTLTLARTAQVRRWDMDAIGTPLVTATADISTLPGLLLGVRILGNTAFHVTAGGLLIATALAALIAGLRSGSPLTRRVVRESLPSLAYAGLMGTLAGTVLQTRLATLVSDPALLVVIPPFIASSGALGGILSARLSSQLHLGLLVPARMPDRRAALEGSLTALLAVGGYTVVGLAAAGAARVFGLASPPAWQLLAAVDSAGLMATVVLFLVAYYSATASYRFGLDPDNSGIPIVTATMDFLGIVCLVTGISMVGLG